MGQAGAMAVTSEAYSLSAAELAGRFTPTLMELVRAGLLERDERGRWVLVAAAQGWLDGRATRPRPPAEARVAVGLRCQQCGESGLTSMADGRRLCASCKVVDGYVDAEPLPQLRPRRPPLEPT
jgi:formylmethanofuran dehydrogenase subunit E